MSPDKDRELRARHPLVFPGPLHDDEPIRTGDGWFHLLDKVFDDLSLYINGEPPGEQARLRAVCVKEKFGVLRIYLEREPSDMTHPIGFVIRAARWASSITCDVCGSTGGRLRGGERPVRPMLLRTRCDEHADWFEEPTGFAHATKGGDERRS